MLVTPHNEFIHDDDTGFNVTVYCVPSQPIKSFELKISFNPAVLQAVKVYEGDIFGTYSTFFSAGIINNTAGTLINIYNLIIGPGNVTLPGSLVIIHFNYTSLGGSAIHIYGGGVTNETKYVDLVVTDGCRRIYGDYMPWDINDDGHCNYIDLSTVVSHYTFSCEPGTQTWDIISDGTCNYLEISFIVANLGK